MKVVHLTKKEFIENVFDYENNKDWKYKGDKPCLIDFYADWCGPCKVLSPVLEDLAKVYGNDVVIYKVNTEQETDLASAFNIRSIPSILFIPKEGTPEMMQGALPKTELSATIDRVLLNK